MRTRTIFAILLALAPTLLGVVGCGAPPAGVRQAERLLRAGDYEQAQQVAEAELERHPGHPTLWRVRIQAALGLHDSPRAVQLYRQWYKLRGAHDGRALRAMALATLWQGLQVPSPVVKRQAIRAVERLELDQLAEPVAERMGDDDITVQATAAVAILSSHPDAPYVATLAMNSSNPEARAIAIEGIGRKIGRRAKDDVVAALTDPEPQVRRAAVTALARFATKQEAPLLARIATGDADGQTRARALRALATLSVDSVPVARRALHDDYLGARLAAVYLLHRRGGKAVVDDLTLLARSNDLFVALRAGVALASRGRAKAAFEVAGRALAAAEWTIRAAALNAIGQLADHDRGLALLRTAAGDPAPGVRLAAARALARLGDKPASLQLLGVLVASAATADRVPAAIELTRLGDPRGLRALDELLATGDLATRKAALAGYAQLTKPSEALVAALADSSAEIRVQAAEILLSQ